ncbi:MAG: hypothetical protein IPK75_12770 [Acidobacteria bacterium]|nr:hypothetical protein [Acidobacteriota bacterium]
MAEITINQELPVHISPRDSRGNIARVDGPPVWKSSDEALVEILPGADEFDKVVRPKGIVGAALITCTVDADLGEGVKNLVGQLTVTVLPGEASTLAINAGTPVATQPAPAANLSPAAEQPAADPVSTDTAAPADAAGEATAEVTTDPGATEAVAADGTVTEQPAAEAVAETATEAQAETAPEAVTETQPEGGATTAG